MLDFFHVRDHHGYALPRRAAEKTSNDIAIAGKPNA